MSVTQERNSELVDLLLADYLPRPKAGTIYRLVIPDTLTPGFVIVNEDGTIEIAVDTANHRVGIGTGSPNVTLDVRGAADIIGNLQVSGSGLFTAVITARGGIQNDAGVLTLNDTVEITGDVYTDVWTDYSATSTIVGWSSFTTKIINYKKIGKLVFVDFAITGTSDSTSTSFTLPYSEAHPGNARITAILARDNSGTRVMSYGAMNSATAILVPGPAGGSWTASGTKEVYGQFWYEST